MLPYGISLLHIFCYFENHKLVKICLINNCRYTLTLHNESPLSIAINRQSFACIEVIAKYIGGTYKTNPEVYKSIENELVKLNKASPASLVDFYDSAFVVQTGLPGYGNLKKHPSYERFSLTPGIDPSLFLGTGTNEHRIQFKSMLFRLNPTMGSTKSMAFMNSLIESTNKEVFRMPFIQDFLAYKWGKIKKFIWLRSCLYGIMILTLFSAQFSGIIKILGLVSLLILNTIFLVLEAFQALVRFSEYRRNIWNMIDVIQIVGIYTYVLSETIQAGTGTEGNNSV